MERGVARLRLARRLGHLLALALQEHGPPLVLAVDGRELRRHPPLVPLDVLRAPRRAAGLPQEPPDNHAVAAAQVILPGGPAVDRAGGGALAAAPPPPPLPPPGAGEAAGERHGVPEPGPALAEVEHQEVVVVAVAGRRFLERGGWDAGEVLMSVEG